MNTNEQIAIRFFEVLDDLKARKVIHGVRNFYVRYDIDQRNVYQLRKEPHRNIFKAWWLSALVEDYNVSATWLLTGKGKMYDKK